MRVEKEETKNEPPNSSFLGLYALRKEIQFLRGHQEYQKTKKVVIKVDSSFGIIQSNVDFYELFGIFYKDSKFFKIGDANFIVDFQSLPDPRLRSEVEGIMFTKDCTDIGYRTMKDFCLIVRDTLLFPKLKDILIPRFHEK